MPDMNASAMWDHADDMADDLYGQHAQVSEPAHYVAQDYERADGALLIVDMGRLREATELARLEHAYFLEELFRTYNDNVQSWWDTAGRSDGLDEHVNAIRGVCVELLDHYGKQHEHTESAMLKAIVLRALYRVSEVLSENVTNLATSEWFTARPDYANQDGPDGPNGYAY